MTVLSESDIMDLPKWEVYMHGNKGRKQSPEQIAKRVKAWQKTRRTVGFSGSPPGRPENTPEVIWSKVDKRGPDECWPWMGWRNEQGYGRLEIKDVSYYAHRVIFDLACPGLISREAPGDKKGFGFIRHSCDNPPCCNPAHLTVGTAKDNIDDRRIRGRAPNFKGDRGPRCKLTMEQAREARALRKTGIAVRQLAERFGLSVPSMKTLLNGKSYQESD
jgi:hypothetical protein